MPFEYFVRPFQTPDSQGRIIVPSTPGSTHERATLTWGAKVTVDPVTKDQVGVNVECCGETLTENDRKGSDFKITAANDPDTFITVNRATEVRFQKKQEDKCASDWDQMSGVASAVDGAFASLSADIHASDSAFGKTDHCKQTMKLNPNTTGATPA